MKNLPLTLLAACLFAAGFTPTLRAQTPILEFKFNEANPTTATSSGSNTATGVVTGAYATGVSGAGDYAFDNNASNGMGTLATNGGGVQLGTALGGWKSFTLQGWINSNASPAEQLNNAARLIDGFSTANSAGFQLRADAAANNNAGAMVLTVDGASVTSAAGYAATNQWVFFAVTYDVASHTANFYVGDTATSVSQLGTGLTLNIGTGVTTTKTTGSNIAIGNLSGGTNRPYDGLMDDVRIFGSTIDSSGALSLAQLESFRALDVQAVPEPTAAALMILGGVLFLFTSVRRKPCLA